MNKLIAGGLIAAGILTGCTESNVVKQELELTEKWDKIFPQSDKVDHCKVTFHNRFGITLAADLYKPKNVSGRLPAIAVSGPFGAVKEQSSGITPSSWRNGAFSPSPSILLSPANRAALRASWHRPTSIPKTFPPRWII